MTKEKTPPKAIVKQIGRESDLEEFDDLAQTLQTLSGPIPVEIPDNDDDLAAAIASDVVRQARDTAKTALKVAILKDRCKHGQFLKLLAAHGVHERAASRYLQFAQFLKALPPASQPKYFGAALTKVSALSQLSADDIQAAAESGELDEWMAMPKSELIQKIKLFKRRAVEQAHDLDKANIKYEKLQHHLDHRHDHLQMPAFAAVTREESAALTEKMLACIESLQSLVDQNLLAERDEPEGERFQRMAAGTLFHSLLPVMSRARDVLAQIDEHYGKEVTSGVKFDHQLVKQESAHYLKARAALLELHGKQAKNREAIRENAKGGKGRPRKVEEGI